MFGTRTLIFLGILAIAAAIDPNNICVLVSDGTRIVDDTSCSSYYTCKAGKATAEECQSGYYFDKNIQGCLPASQVNCKINVENPCEGVEDKKFVSNPESCKAYYYCMNGAISSGGVCPLDYYFDEKNQKCDYLSNVQCGSSGGGSESADNPNLMCAYVPNGIFFGSASNCQAWAKCTDDVIKDGSCTGTYVFNVQTKACDFKDNYNCQQLEGDAGETGGPSTQCSVPNAIKENGNSCSSYLKCSNNEWVEVNCPSGLYYEPGTNLCKSRKEAVTFEGCNRCEGTKLDFANQVGDGCKGYMRCTNGVQGSDGECGTGYYFNEDFGHCVNESPGFRVCLDECADCDPDTSTTKNNCNSDCDTVTCDCTCISCEGKELPPCASCLPTDKTQVNRCNDANCEANENCECTCDQCEVVPPCDPTNCITGGGGPTNKCNDDDCEAAGDCGCTCDSCNGVQSCEVTDCVTGGGGPTNKCNDDDCEAAGDCGCICDSCNGVQPCEVANCVTDGGGPTNKCNDDDCEAAGDCECICDSCNAVPLCDVTDCVTGGGGPTNKCNDDDCEAAGDCECTCDSCNVAGACEVTDCVAGGGGPTNKCNDDDCEAAGDCECTCDECEE